MIIGIAESSMDMIEEDLILEQSRLVFACSHPEVEAPDSQCKHDFKRSRNRTDEDAIETKNMHFEVTSRVKMHFDDHV